MTTAMLPKIRTIADLKRHLQVGRRIVFRWNWSTGDVSREQIVARAHGNAVAFTHHSGDPNQRWWHRYGKRDQYRFDDTGFDYFDTDGKHLSRYDYVPE